MNKKIMAIMVIFLVLGSALSACAPKQAPQPTAKRVVYLINGALGDNAFYDSGKAGIDNLAKQYGVETRTIECNFDAGKYEPSLQAAVDYADVIFVISYGFEDQLKAIADKYPNKIFVNIDTVVENPKKTITSVDFIEEESAYLAGVVAGLATTDTTIKNINPDKIIGVVGGDVDPVVSAFVFAYQNGAHSVDPQIQVLKKSLGGAWDDSAKGKQAALQLYDQKADIVFQVAAAAGIGVLQAARERELYAIGVDTNQNDLEPGYVIASDVKNVGKTIEDVYKTINDGSYKAGQVLKYGIAKGGVDIALDAKVKVLPQSIVDKVMALRQQIIDGTLVIQLYDGSDVWQ
ncbi:MAG: BMP family ABC transporter substrate-binding protein [Anaerolineales bacterium]